MREAEEGTRRSGGVQREEWERILQRLEMNLAMVEERTAWEEGKMGEKK